jgi:tetratricopeptide (TPR) repeat protein
MSGRGRPLRRLLVNGLSGASFAFGVLWASSALAVSAADAPNLAQRAVSEADRDSATVEQTIANARAAQKTPEQRLVDGELLLKARDYPRAIIVLNEITEKYPSHPTVYPDAMLMLGDAYYESGQLLSARRAYKAILDNSGEPRMTTRTPRAFVRLVDVALRKQNYKELDELLTKISGFSGAAEPTVQYGRAKALLAKKDFAAARAAVDAVPPTHPLLHQAKYLRGVIEMRDAQASAPAPAALAPGQSPPAAPPTRYASSIDAFRQVTQLSPDSEAHRLVIDYAWLAIGRLFYEADQWVEAADAYGHVDRESPEFAASLYEVAWVYVRLGDYDRALRALEVLAISDPNNQYVADATLLRADLMLRSGQFDKALTSYDTIRTEYDPLRERVDTFLASSTDPAVFYDKLTKEEIDSIDKTTQVPAIAIQWAREEQDGVAAFAVIDDVVQCRDLIRQSQALIQKLEMVLGATNRVRAFPDLRAGDEKLLSLLNKVTQARGTIAQGLDDAEPSEVSGELAAVRAERRELQKRVQFMPVTDADFANREIVAQRSWNQVSQKLQQLQLEVDQLQAIVNGLRRMLADSSAGKDPTVVAQWQSELLASENELKGFKTQIDTTRRQIDVSRVGAGYGDQRFIEDEEVRAQFKLKLAEELRLVGGGAGGSKAQSYASQVSGPMASADTTETKLLGIRKDLLATVDKKVAEVNEVIQKEAANISSYAARLEVLDQEARLVVGQVAMRNFGLVRDRLKDLVIHADVGSVEQAWEVREEQITRVRNLQVERVREEQILREELREVLDDASDPAQAPLGSSEAMSSFRSSVFGRGRPAVVASVLAAVVFGASGTAFSQGTAKPPAKPAAKTSKAGAAASSAAAPAPPPPATASAEPAAEPLSTPIPTSSARPVAPPPPPPSDAQVQALEKLAGEAKIYETDARDFRDAVTGVVKHHYEERRRRVLSGLDSEIAIEKAELKKARDEAIRRLEEFVARYSGPNAHQEHTPDAMFRLAALYEERGRAEGTEQDLAIQLKPAMTLYKRIIREFPKYREMAAVFYYLGHSLNDSGRLVEAQQVWRSLVCHNKFPYPVATEPTDPDKDQIYDKDQDHSEKYWNAWMQQHPDPIKRPAATKTRGKAAVKPIAKKDTKPKDAGQAGLDEPQSSDEETVYRPIYTEACVPIPQTPEPGKEPRYLTEVWWQIGDHHFEQLDPKGGPFNFNRGRTAYQLSMKQVKDRSKNVVYGVSMYKLAWTYFKQQRYEAAVKQFVELLNYTDEREKETGDPGADFRKEAFDYIAGSLTYGDFQGPAEDEPFIFRQDIIDTETNPTIAEQKMRVGIDRVQDPMLVPQDKKWTIEVYKSLAREYQEIPQRANATLVLELILQKWPMHRDAPIIQDEIARTYDERAKYAVDGTSEKETYAAKALEARTKLAQYIGNTPWVDANKDDPEAIQTAERLVKGGLRQAAVEHTNNARNFTAQGNQSTVDSERRTYFDKALTEYMLAESAWTGYLHQDENATDAYESRYWLADSRYRQVELMVPLGKPVPPDLYVRARQASVEVRDSNEDDRFLEVTAQYVVAIADASVKEQYNLFKSSGGSQGFEERTELKTTGDDSNLQVETVAVPPQLVQAIASRDEYASRVQVSQDALGNLQLFRFQSAQIFFFYGQLDDAKKRFYPIYQDQCKKSKYGFLAWEKLQKIANVQGVITGDLTESRKLAEAEQSSETSCAYDDATKAVAESIIKPTIQGGFYKDAAAAFKKASEMPDGPERVQAWKTAGALYETALKAAPDRKEAPEAAINGAYCYKQVGDYDKAIEMYRLFIDKYGDDKILTKVQKDDPAEYAERVKNLELAYRELSRAYILFFNYRSAAETLDKIASIDRFSAETRKDAARNALVLYTNLGDKEKMASAKARFLTFKPTGEDKAEADYIVAAADLRLWDPNGADEGGNRTARQRAQASLMQYYDANKNNASASRFAVNAAYHVAKMKKAGGENKSDEWLTSTIKSFEKYKATAPSKDGKNVALGSLEGEMAAEADFTLVDAEIKKNFDYDTGHHRFKGTVVDVLKQYNAAAKDAEKYHAKLKRVVDANTYGSIEYVTAGLSRQGSLYDSLRTGLFNTREPQLQLFTAAEEKILKQLEESGNDEFMDKAAEKRSQRTVLWRTKRDQELTSADTIMIQRYTSAVTIARKYNIRSTAVNKALQRLAFFTDVLGDEKLRQYSAGVEGFTYTDAMFQKTRPGMVVEPEVSPQPMPLPVVLQ